MTGKGLLDVANSPPASAYGAEPLAVAEIDAHPDRDRIWATVMAMRGDADRIYSEGFDDGAMEYGDRFG